MKFSYNHKRTGKVDIDIVGFNKEDYIFNMIKKRKTFYEHDLLSYLDYVAPKGGIYVDVGSNIGNHSIFFGKFLADFVVCIDANANLIQVLERNLQKNLEDKFRIFNYAVGSKEGRGKIILPDYIANNIGAARVEVVNDEQNKNSEYITVKTLDSILEKLDENLKQLPVQVIKIDIEGMEIEALKGAMETIRKYRPHLIVEVIESNNLEIESLLSKLGYENTGRFCATPTYHYIPKEKSNAWKKIRHSYSKFSVRIQNKLERIKTV